MWKKKTKTNKTVWCQNLSGMKWYTTDVQCKLCPGEKPLTGHDLSMSTTYSERTFRALLTYPRHISVEIMDLCYDSLL